MSNGDVKVRRVRRENKVLFDLLGEVISPDTLHSRVPRLGEVNEARIQHKNRLNTIRELSKTADQHMHYVAQIDVSIWSIILDIFAKHDPLTGELMDDGLLYKWNPDKECVELNRTFFYALINMLEDSGYTCDMRRKTNESKIMI
jgi:hypothetical protein